MSTTGLKHDNITSDTITLAKNDHQFQPAEADNFTCDTISTPPRKYHIGTATEADRKRLISKASFRALDVLDEIEQRRTRGFRGGGGCCAKDRDDAAEYAIYCQLSIEEGDITPPPSIELARERWVISKMSMKQRVNLARVGDRRFLSGEVTQLIWDKSGLDRDKIIKDASEKLGNGTETLPEVDYDRIVRSRIATGGEESFFLPAPSKLSPEQEEFVMKNWSWEVAKQCRDEAHSTRCAEACLEYDLGGAVARFRDADTKKNESMVASSDALTRQAAEEEETKAGKEEVRMTAKETEDERSCNGTETLSAGLSLPMTALQDLQLNKELLQSTDTGSQEMLYSLPKSGTLPSQSERPRSICQQVRRWFSRKTLQPSFPAQDSMSKSRVWRTGGDTAGLEAVRVGC